MAKKTQEHLPRWLVYLIPLVLGVAFSLAIFFVVWNKSLNSNNQSFLLETVSFKEKITRNIIACENVATDIQNLLNTYGKPEEKLFNEFTSGLFDNYHFIEAFQYQEINTLASKKANIKNKIRSINDLKRIYESKREVEKELSFDNIIGEQNYLISVNSVLSGTKFSIASQKKSPSMGYFILFSLVDKQAEHLTDDVHENVGLLTILVNTDKLFEDVLLKNNISINVFSESSGLAGRQLLYNNRATQKKRQGWLVDTLEDQHSFQLPSYSIKFNFKKDLYWQDIDQALIIVSLFIGLGITLLLVALVRSKEIQSRELRQRNILIQKTVDEQTKELAIARDKAVDASKIKSEFLASMSHEIRTPLNAIIGISELMTDTPLNQDQTKYIKIFRKAGDTLLSLVNDILDLSKIEAQQLILEDIPFSLIELVEESVDIYAVKAAEKKINLVARVAPGTETSRVGDPTRLRQIILNLISNALKFTEQGEILLTVKKSKQTNEKDYLIFSVSDTGIGIPKDKLDLIFASFTQVDSSTSRKYGGTGLGLTISKSLAHMMNGRIWVESVEGQGSTFSFAAELGYTDEVPAITGSFPVINLTGNRVLIVDDNSTNRLILKDTLEMMHAQTVEAASGQMALDIINHDDNFTLYLIDYEMPEMDGVQLIEMFIKNGIDLKKIIMISSAIYGEEIQRVKGLNLGAYLHKPLKRAELLQQVSQILYGDKNEETTQHNKDEVEVTFEIKSILLVEDNEDNRLLVNAFLKDGSYRVDEAVNGEIAVQKFSENKYDLVLMDVQMPIMDGHQATRKIRAWEYANKMKPTPIIALTAHAIREEIDKCIDAGCDTHLGKPIKKLTLLATIEQYV